MITKDVIQKFNDWYGPGSGFSVCSKVMPGIIADFEKMVKKNPTVPISETYHLEDRKGTVIITWNGQKMEIECRDGV